MNDFEQAEFDALRVENTALRRELHHRVRNNLQTVASLVELTAREAAKDDVEAAFAALSARIAAIAAVYQIVEEPTHLAAVDISDVIKVLLTPTLRSLAMDALDPLVAVTVDPVVLTLDEAIPVALFVNEALHSANLLGPQVGSVGRVSLVQTLEGDRDILELTVSAPLLPDQPPPAKGRLMEGIARQVSGEVSAGEAEGEAVFVLKFTSPPPGGPR